MDNNINSTENSGFFNITSRNSSECPSYIQYPLIPGLCAIDWILALPSVSWALWLLCREFRLTLETEFFMFNLLCVDMVFSIFNIAIFFNTLFLFSDILNYFGVVVFYVSFYAHPYLQCCMCIERYLAVVHPVTFLKFRQVRYKVAALMLDCPLILAFSLAEDFSNGPYVPLAYLILVACVEIFCSLSILRVLKNTGPGDEIKKERERSNTAKKKAFIIVLMFQIKQLVNYMPFVIITLIRGVFPLALYNCYLYYLATSLCLYGNFIESFHYLQRTGRLSFIPGL